MWEREWEKEWERNEKVGKGERGDLAVPCRGKYLGDKKTIRRL